MSFHHGVNLRHSDVCRKKKRAHFCKKKLRLAGVRPSFFFSFSPVYNSFISTDSCVRISAGVSYPLSPLLSLLLLGSEGVLATQQGHESHQLDSAAENIRPHQRTFSRTFPRHGAAPTAQTEMTGKIMRSEALLDETHTQLVSPHAHLWFRSPPLQPVSTSPPTPPPTHIHTRAHHPLSGPVRNSGGRRIAWS